MSGTNRIQIPKPLLNLNWASEEARAKPRRQIPETKRPPQRAFPLGMVLEACPDIADYSRHGITSWRDFMATAGVVRSMLGISPSAWAEACEAMGEEGRRDHGGCHPSERGGDQESGWLSPQPDRTSEGWAVFARAGAHGAAASESRRWRPENASMIYRGRFRAAAFPLA